MFNSKNNILYLQIFVYIFEKNLNGKKQKLITITQSYLKLIYQIKTMYNFKKLNLMNRNVFFAATLSILALILFSCMTATIPSYRASTIRIADIKTSPLISDLQIDQTRKTGTAINNNGENFEELKIAAIADVLEKNNGDILIEPSFTIETRGSSNSVSVSGFVAKYTNIKQTASPADGLNSVMVVHPLSISVPTNTPTKKKGLLGLIGF